MADKEIQTFVISKENMPKAINIHIDISGTEEESQNRSKFSDMAIVFIIAILANFFPLIAVLILVLYINK